MFFEDKIVNIFDIFNIFNIFMCCPVGGHTLLYPDFVDTELVWVAHNYKHCPFEDTVPVCFESNYELYQGCPLQFLYK